MVIFCLITMRRINLVRLILDFILSAINAERRRHATLPYGMFLTRVFVRAQLPIEGHGVETKRSTTTMKTFSALGMKPQAPLKEKENRRKRKSRKRRRKKRRKTLLSRKILLLRRINPSLLKRKRRYLKEVSPQYPKSEGSIRGDC